jgi:hypothetical protein
VGGRSEEVTGDGGNGVGGGGCEAAVGASSSRWVAAMAA